MEAGASMVCISASIGKASLSEVTCFLFEVLEIEVALLAAFHVMVVGLSVARLGIKAMGSLVLIRLTSMGFKLAMGSNFGNDLSGHNPTVSSKPAAAAAEAILT